MYVWIWDHLPGPLPVRLLATLVLASVAVLLLMLVVFPAIEPLLPWQAVPVDGAAAQP